MDLHLCGCVEIDEEEIPLFLFIADDGDGILDGFHTDVITHKENGDARVVMVANDQNFVLDGEFSHAFLESAIESKKIIIDYRARTPGNVPLTAETLVELNEGEDLLENAIEVSEGQAEHFEDLLGELERVNGVA